MAKEIKKGVESQAVSVAGQLTEKNIPNLIAQIDVRLQQLVGDKEKDTRITGELQGEKVSDVKDVMRLRELYTYIRKKSEAVAEDDAAFKAIAPTAKIGVYKEGGHTAEQWKAEILKQYRDVTFEAEVEKLKKAKKAFQDCLSEEAKREAKLKDAASELKDLLNLED